MELGKIKSGIQMNKENTSTIEAVIKRRKNKSIIKDAYLSLLIRIVLLAILGLILFSQVFIISRAKGNSMFPALKDGDLII